jgi:phytoene dehydrogenase-like protein
VAALYDASSPGYRRLIEPLTVAALNTAPGQASSRLLRRVVLGAWRGPRAVLPLVAERGLGPDLVEPLAAEVRRRGGMIETGRRVRRLAWQDGRVAALDFGEVRIRLGPGDRVVLAVSPAEAERLAGLEFGFDYSPIVNAHFELEGLSSARPRMVGVLGAAAQWILLRGSIASVTVSAADDLADLPAEQVAGQLWTDVRASLRLIGLTPTETLPRHRIVKERRATIRQTPGLRRPGAVTAWRNLFLAGDWTDTGLPATIEGALRSGVTAARATLRSV